MKKNLGKKTNVQDGTLVAFSSCSCTSNCSISNCSNNDTTAKAQAYSKLLSIAISGQWGW